MAAERVQERQRRPAGDGDQREDGQREDGQREGGQREGGQREGGTRIGAREAAHAAADYLEEMTGQPPEVVIATEPIDSGWLVTVEVLELARIPDTTDLLGSYQVELDAQGEPQAYRRTRRYHRGRVGDD